MTFNAPISLLPVESCVKQCNSRLINTHDWPPCWSIFSHERMNMWQATQHAVLRPLPDVLLSNRLENRSIAEQM